MTSNSLRSISPIWHALALLLVSCPVLGGVSREVENEYRGRYANRAMFLKVPVFGDRQVVYPRGGGVVPDPSSSAAPLTFKVGEQVRITQLDFRDSEIEFRISAVDLGRRAVLVFSFGQSLTHTFAQRDSFEAALAASFTEGLTYRDIEQAKDEYVRSQFQRQIRQFAETTGSDTDSVLESMLAASPKYRELLGRADDAEQQNRRLTASLKEELTARGQAEAALETARQRIAELERSGTSSRRERDELVSERDRLRRELQELQNASRRIQEQVTVAASKLDVQLDSNAQLGRQVQALSQNIENLQKERNELAQRSSRLEERVNLVTRERDKLSTDLSSASRENAKLQADLRALTSNRESLQATYLRTREARDRLEAADQLGGSLQLKWREPLGRDENGPAADLYLMSQRLGSLALRIPEKPGESGTLTVKMDSPDTVQFSEEERRLFDALGRRLMVEADWVSWTGVMQPVLSEGEPTKSVAPREEATWTWTFAGVPQRAEKLSLRLRVRDANDLVVPLGEYQAEVKPAGFAGLMSSLSWLSLLAGVLLGSVFGGGMIAMTRRRALEPRRQSRSYSGEKAL